MKDEHLKKFLNALKETATVLERDKAKAHE